MMRILPLDGGQVSLEMAPDEAVLVLTQLEDEKGFVRSIGATHDLLDKGSVRLILMDEWDEPCLLSTDEAGAALLRSLADDGEFQRPASVRAHG